MKNDKDLYNEMMDIVEIAEQKTKEMQFLSSEEKGKRLDAISNDDDTVGLAEALLFEQYETKHYVAIFAANLLVELSLNGYLKDPE